MRKLASIRAIDALTPIEGADKIEVATIGGWKVVCQKGLYNVGDLAVYFEIDSFIPTAIAPFLTKPGHTPKVFNGVEGERLKTVRLRGQLSQGLLIPIKELYGKLLGLNDHFDGQDVTEHLGIQKWEPFIPAQLAGNVKGNFPTLVPKTDQERVQNLKKEIHEAAGRSFEVTEKLEGSSMTCYLIEDVFGVCSRNLDLKRDENNTFWQVAIRDDIEQKMRSAHMGGGYAIQGELIGPGIQGNIYKLGRPEFHVFDVYNIADGCYLNPQARRNLVEHLGLKHVPVVDVDFDLPDSVDELLLMAEDKSVLNRSQEREGIVFKDNNGGMSFKAISNRYLLKAG